MASKFGGGFRIPGTCYELWMEWQGVTSICERNVIEWMRSTRDIHLWVGRMYIVFNYK